MKSLIRIGILLSGSGTTLQNLLDREVARVACVVSSRADAFGVERARRAGIPTTIVERKAFGDRETFTAATLGPCREAGVNLICMAGYLQLLTIPGDFAGRILNIHPSLLPSFGGKGMHGLNVHKAVLEAGVKLSGCTVHFADNEYDRGPIVVQKAVAVSEEDTPETLQARVFAAECEAYPEAIELFASGRLHIEGRRVRVARV
ncbi:MAG: phosphoribosylglycinamide formyltransferase [Planctomycetia bacterium]|nr:phosphoribosylglycinamide formyltransferase [Planctomycetia bacterium]